MDKKITAEAKLVYAALSGSTRKGSAVASVGQRRIAGMLGLGLGTVSRKIAELKAADYIKSETAGSGIRSSYRLLRLLLEKQPAEIAAPRADKPKMAGCRTCARPTAHLSLDALCRPCVKAAEEIRRVREAIAQIGESATEEQIAAHLQLTESTRSIRRALRAIREAA